jgi:4-amino-4-deoxy-L-arabinose transferase-like glycosyltransferase
MILPLGVSQVAVHDIGLIPFMCVACWCLHSISVASAFRRNTLLLAVTAGIALGLSILTKGLVGCVFAGIFAACLAIRRPAAIWPLAIALTVAGVAAVLVAAPWYVAMEHAHPGYLHYYFIERHLQGYLTATQRHAGRPWWYYVPIVLGGALPWAGYLVHAARTARRDRLRLVVWGWFAIGLVFLSIGESKLVTYALPLFPAVAILIAASLDTRSDKSFAAAFALHSFVIVGLPAAGLLAIKWKYGAGHPGLWPLVAGTSIATAYALRRAWIARQDDRFMTWTAAAAIASLAGTMIVMPRAADWMTSRDLAAALNARGALPSRVSVVDERIGSLVFYLSPALRGSATAERLADVTFSDAVLGVRVGPDDSVVAVRTTQLDRFNRLFPRPPTPDERAGTFAIYRTITLRETLQPR